jgi:hypothetical protein
VVDAAVAQLVRDTYLLDAYGDLGNEQRIVAAYADFVAALGAVAGAYPAGGR